MYRRLLHFFLLAATSTADTFFAYVFHTINYASHSRVCQKETMKLCCYPAEVLLPCSEMNYAAGEEKNEIKSIFAENPPRRPTFFFQEIRLSLPATVSQNRYTGRGANARFKRNGSRSEYGFFFFFFLFFSVTGSSRIDEFLPLHCSRTPFHVMIMPTSPPSKMAAGAIFPLFLVLSVFHAAVRACRNVPNSRQII